MAVLLKGLSNLRVNTLNFSSRRHELKAFLFGLVTNTLTIVQRACLSLMWILDKIRKKATNIWQILKWSFSSKVKYYFWFLLFISFLDLHITFSDGVQIFIKEMKSSSWTNVSIGLGIYITVLYSALCFCPLSRTPKLLFNSTDLEECTQYYLFIIPSHFTFKGKREKVVH